MGSSPRMRGTQMVEGGPESASGIIPAYAGNTSHRHERGNCCRDHPRVCGEHTSMIGFAAMTAGSSPRMRGTLEETADDACAGGIIPAYAGNTPPQSGPVRGCRDHPRVCGEHVQVKMPAAGGQGSSPRMRGTHGRARLPVPRPVDHPRVCGEHPSRPPLSATRMGSSPRMRGTPREIDGCLSRPGIIPAYAGNTKASTMACCRVWDHPRVCGEHRVNVHDVHGFIGSSPRMRGTLAACEACYHRCGIIPAYAGNTADISIMQ